MKYKVIPENVVKNLVEFLDDVQFEAAKNNTPEDIQTINFCSWIIQELLNSYDAYFKKEDTKDKNYNDKKPSKKSRDDYVEETFMDWNLPEMSDEEYEKLVDQFDAFLRSWEKEYNKKNKNNSKKQINKRPRFHRPDVKDVAEYMSLDEIKEFLIDDPELSNEERFELYYDERERVKREKEDKSAMSFDDMLKDIGINPYKEDSDEKSDK
tara:strand:- start:183 stop:812 length:630 start_codon:yes stop_codon:yes gene_type:complete